MSTSHEEWLSQTQEAAIEPELAICDPHHHLWDRNGDRYLLAELLEDTSSGHRVVSTVFVECMSEYREDGPEEMRPVGETDFVESVAASSASMPDSLTAVAAGIVSFADLGLGEGAGRVLEAHLGASPERFKGIRHASGWDPSDEVRNSHTDPPPRLLFDERFRRGFAELERLGLSFDAWHYHQQIPDLVDLARAFPGVSIILDHVGGPLGIGPWAGRRDEVREQWLGGIRELACCPNVYLKLGGLAMPICGFGWHRREEPPGSATLARAWKPYLEPCIDLFSPARCMFESNFPVDKRSCSYAVLWNAFKRIAAGYSASEKAALFCNTAVRAYRLE